MSPGARKRFELSKNWGLTKQLLVAVSLIVGAGVATSIVFGSGNRDDEAAPSLEVAAPPTLTVASTLPVDDTAPATAVATPDTDQAQAGVTTVEQVEAPSPTVAVTTATEVNLGGGLLAADVLASIPVELEYRGQGYSRDLFAIWIDEDGDGCDTRVEVLLEESTVPPPPGNGCDVTGLRWFSVFDGVSVEQASELDIDHLVSLKETWDSGAWSWSPEQRIAYGNDLTDPRTLIAVTASSNRSKGDRDPSNWIPAPEYLCQYVADWIAVKARWSLTMDESEHGRLRNLIRDRCPGLEVTPYE